MLEQELGRQSGRPGLCGARSRSEGGHLLWRVPYKRRHSPCMAFSLRGNPRPSGMVSSVKELRKNLIQTSGGVNLFKYGGVREELMVGFFLQ